IAALSASTGEGSARSLLKIGSCSRPSWIFMLEPAGMSSPTTFSRERLSDVARVLPQIPRSVTPVMHQSNLPGTAPYTCHYVLQQEATRHAVARRGAARTLDTDAARRHALHQWASHQAAVSGGNRARARDVRHGVFLGRRTQVLADAGRLHHGGR